MEPGRERALDLSKEGIQISRFCASGLDAVNFAAGPGRAELTNLSGPTIGATSTIGTVTGGTPIVNVIVASYGFTDLTTNGAVTQADDSRLEAVEGNIRVQAQTDIVLGGATTSTNVTLYAVTGSILDAGDFGGEEVVDEADDFALLAGKRVVARPIEGEVARSWDAPGELLDDAARGFERVARASPPGVHVMTEYQLNLEHAADVIVAR
mgnify:CR=1 FL=1